MSQEADGSCNNCRHANYHKGLSHKGGESKKKKFTTLIIADNQPVIVKHKQQQVDGREEITYYDYLSFIILVLVHFCMSSLDHCIYFILFYLENWLCLHCGAMSTDWWDPNTRKTNTDTLVSSAPAPHRGLPDRCSSFILNHRRQGKPGELQAAELVRSQRAGIVNQKQTPSLRNPVVVQAVLAPPETV